MKNFAVIILVFVFLVACNGNSQNHDSDDLHDSDQDSKGEQDLQDEQDEKDNETDDTEKPDETSDIDNAECLPAHIDAGYPYYRNDGSIHFCRACDKPTNNDPDCIANLWVDGNRKLYAAHPDKDCLGYPCMMDDLTPFYSGEREGYYLDKCDMMINANNPKGWQTGMVTFKHYNLSEGKVGFVMDHAGINAREYPADVKAVEFDIKNRSYKVMRMGSTNDTLTYHKGAFLNVVWDKGLRGKDDSPLQYLVYSDAAGKMKVVYNKPLDFIIYTPRISDKWAFANVREVEGGPSEMKYAKIGEWKWKSLGEGIAYDPNIVGDKLALYLDTFEGYICNLSESPASLSSCLKINRDGEEIRHPVMDEENSETVYFNPLNMLDGFMKLDLSKNPAQYSEIKLEGLLDPRFSVAIQGVKGKMILYSDVFVCNTDSGERDFRTCYYRTDLNKSFCSLATPQYQGEMEYTQSAPEFEDHWLIWQDSDGPLMKLRDMECYCDHHPELCPFDDYTPQPDNPKDVKTGKRLKD